MVKRSAKSRRHRTGCGEGPFQLCVAFQSVQRKQKRADYSVLTQQDAGVPKMHFLSLEMKALDALKAIDRLLNPSQQAVE